LSAQTAKRVVDRRSWLRGARHARWRGALAPLGWLYGAASAGVRAARTLSAAPPPEGCTVISVGNLEAGGSGKTPLAIHLLERAAELGRRPAYASRAWGGRAGRFPGVTLVPPAGEPPPTPPGGARVLSRDVADAAEELGDEAAVVALRAPGAGLALGADKKRAVALAADGFAAGVVVLDDAFQSWTVGRHVDVVLLDAAAPLGDGRLLPAGRLREEPNALARADAVVFNGAHSPAAVARLAPAVAHLCAEGVAFGGLARAVTLTDGRGSTAAGIEGRVACACGLARPEAFERAVGEAGAEVALAVRYDDHYRYRPADLAELLREADAARVERIVTTEKDWVKLAALAAPRRRFVVARLEVELVGDAERLIIARMQRC
jgi:tetraacyldisaccharide 4'-kinase